MHILHASFVNLLKLKPFYTITSCITLLENPKISIYVPNFFLVLSEKMRLLYMERYHGIVILQSRKAYIHTRFHSLAQLNDYCFAMSILQQDVTTPGLLQIG